jgi:hypothetical protein
MKTQLQPINWNELEDIDDIPSFSDADEACLDEIQQVLNRHGKAGQFGVTLLHKHFDLSDDEIMLEKQNRADRTLSSRVVKLSELEGISYKATVWRFDTKTIRPVGACASGEYGAHYGYKD